MNISVVIPCHNAGPWIQEALRSVAEQTYQPHEIIVVDDGSTDDSVEKVRSSGVQVRLLHRNYGNAAAARNAGVAEASGEWIAFIDADDWWYKEHLREGVRCVNESSDVAYLSHHDAYRMDQGRSVRLPPLPITHVATGLTHRDLYYHYVCLNNGWPTAGMIIDRDRFLQVGGFDEEQVRRHDADLFQRVIYSRTWSYNSKANWCYRVERPGSISSNYSQCAYYLLRAMLKNEPLYPGPEMRESIRRQAKRAISSALQEGERGEWERAWQLGHHRLGPGDRILYGLAHLWAAPVRRALRVRSRIRGDSRLAGPRRHISEPVSAS